MKIHFNIIFIISKVFPTMILYALLVHVISIVLTSLIAEHGVFWVVTACSDVVGYWP
jgi:hypothetical protein